MHPRKKPVRRKKATPASVGLTAAETRGTGGPEIDRLAAQVEANGGAVVGRYSDPFGGTPLLLAALPVDKVEPTPYQRDASDAHVKKPDQPVPEAVRRLAVNYTRFSKATTFDFDETLDKIIASAAKFNVDRVKQEDVAKSGGGALEEE